uniref:Peptidase A1 domain-containing protein n=1 Tax=Kalanchoe fedtschenkoi TaxID=63787 RepID=A0A7N0V5H2_KALFE
MISILTVWQANISCSITPNSPVAELVGHLGEYLMKIRLGTPPVDIIAVADTGSDLTWTQCQPCTRSSRPCPFWHGIECRDGLCHHDTRYVEGSYSKGFLSTETLRMDSTTHAHVTMPTFIFGCGIDNGGPSGGVGSGVIGLGAGPQSIVTQLGQLSRRKFSYCLIPLGLQGRTSHIHFGDGAAVHGPGTVTVHLARGQHPSFYHVTLEALTVGRARIPFIAGHSGAVQEGNIVIDSGSTIMRLPRHFYAQIKLAVTMQTRAPEVPDPTGVLDLCYRKDHQSLQLPSIVANFRGGDVPLKRYNAFVTTGPVTCLAIVASERVTVYGNVAQQDFLIGFDKMVGTVSFKPFDCTHA